MPGDVQGQGTLGYNSGQWDCGSEGVECEYAKLIQINDRATSSREAGGGGGRTPYPWTRWSSELRGRPGSTDDGAMRAMRELNPSALARSLESVSPFPSGQRGAEDPLGQKGKTAGMSPFHRAGESLKTRRTGFGALIIFRCRLVAAGEPNHVVPVAAADESQWRAGGPTAPATGAGNGMVVWKSGLNQGQCRDKERGTESTGARGLSALVSIVGSGLDYLRCERCERWRPLIVVGASVTNCHRLRCQICEPLPFHSSPGNCYVKGPAPRILGST